jgi:hypothetical protein
MRLFLHFATFSALAFAAVNPRLEKVQSIYILPMGGGMDQFLANRITELGKMQVVTDPQIADTILTDRIGEPFEKKLDLLYGVRKKLGDVVKVEEDEDEKPEKTEKTADSDDKSARDKAAKEMKDKVAKMKAESENDQGVRVSSFGRGKGTFFLVDRGTRSVIWSIYEKPKSTTPDELNKTAEKVVNHLKHDLKPQVAN